MDQILKGIVASDHPEHIKKTLIQQLVTKSANELPEDQCKSVFEISSQWMAKENTVFLNESGKLVLTSWGKHHKEAFQRFFTEDYLLHFVENSEDVSVGSVNYVRTAFELLQHTPHIFSLYTIIRHRANTWISQKNDIDFCASVCRLLIEYDHCWPVGDHLLQMSFSLLHCLAKTELPKSSKQELKSCIRNAGFIAAMMNRILTKNQNNILSVLTELFKVISAPGPNPSVAVASIVQFFTPEVIDTATKMVARSPSLSDENLALALTRMINWLSWPGGRRVDQWIICFLRALAMAGKHNILIQVTLEKLPQVFSRLLFPMVRESTMGVLSHMLLSFKHSPQAFHLIVEHVPDLVRALKRENSTSSKACLQTLAELMHLLMYQHSGFPELYGPVLDSLQDFKKPSDAMIKKWLAQAAWSAKAATQIALSSKVTPKSETGRTGLVNLGNTCYMNSIIQALYMLDEFNWLLMTRTTTTALERVIYRLQEMFAFLKMSQRSAYSPTKFLHVARPPWFSPGSQQDCSEFLKYLLDKIEEEDKIVSNICELKDTLPQKQKDCNIIEETFEGKLLVCHRCRRCNYVSYREEVFTDLPLAFPQNSTGVDRDFSKGLGKSPIKQSIENIDLPNTERSLKGGDIGQRPAVPSISSNSKVEGESSTDSGPSSPSSPSNYSLPKSSGSQSKASSYGIGADDPSISLEEMLGYFFESEILQGSNQYHCEQCQGLQDAERSVVISKAPSFLVLTLKRFSYNIATHQRSKILQNVTYPLKLKLSNNIIRIKDGTVDPRGQVEGEAPLLEERQTNPVGECFNDEKDKLEAPPSKCTKQDLDCAPHSSQMSVDGDSSALTLDSFPSETMYALTSVVVHSGVSSESGHYYCYARSSSHVVQQEEAATVQNKHKTNDCKDAKNSPQDDVAMGNHSWCLFNDSRVSFARFETFSDITKRFPKDTPYLLIYKNISRSGDGNEAGVSKAVDTQENKIRQDLVDAVSLDNLLYLQEIEHESRMLTKPKLTPTQPRDDDDENGPSNSSCGPGRDYSTPFNRFIF